MPGLSVVFEDKNTGERVEWHFEDGLRSYLTDAVAELPRARPMNPSAATSKVPRKR